MNQVDVHYKHTRGRLGKFTLVHFRSQVQDSDSIRGFMVLDLCKSGKTGTFRVDKDCTSKRNKTDV